MLKKKRTFKLAIITVFTLLLFIACGQDTQQPDKKNSTSTTFKIAKSDNDSGGAEPNQNVEAGSDDSVIKGEQATGDVDVDVENDSDKKPGSQADTESRLVEESTEKVNDSNDSGPGVYDPKNILDPFEPLFQEAEKQQAASGRSGDKKTVREKRVNLTPLEKFDISQLKLVAIIGTKHRNIAMVEEATGKGYVVKKGTYIGINSGRVVDIKKDIVIIEEEVEDYMGKLIIRKRELKLQKPLGE